MWVYSFADYFALVEIKFQGDRIDEEQVRNYNNLKDQCAKAKKASKITASEGFKLSLFRYPEDASPKDQPNQQKQPKPKAGNKK